MVDIDLHNIVPTYANNLNFKGIDTLKRVELENKNLKTIMLVLGITVSMVLLYTALRNKKEESGQSIF
jgi:hypothetical protein